jgi:hypothetical protein
MEDHQRLGDSHQEAQGKASEGLYGGLFLRWSKSNENTIQKCSKTTQQGKKKKKKKVLRIVAA